MPQKGASHPTDNQPRDFVGYGPTPPYMTWSGGVKVAVNLVLNYEEGLNVDQLPAATMVAVPPGATMRTAILARGVVGRPLLVVNGDGAVIGVIDEAELYRGMLREAVVQTPRQTEFEQSVAAQA